MSSSTATVVAKCDYWIRVNLAIELCLKDGLISILHNADNDSSYVGLPNDLYQLFVHMQQCKLNPNHALHKVLSQEQWDVLCPPNQQQTNSKDWDITLLVAVIRCELKLKPLGGWKIKKLNANDQSKGAFVYLIRDLRNEIKHGSINEIDTLNKFTSYWDRIEFILRGINYKNMNFFKDLKIDPLDTHTIAITNIVKQLEIDVDDLSNIATDNSKDIIDIKKNIDWIKNFLKHMNDTKADKHDLKALETKHEELTKDLEMKQQADHNILSKQQTAIGGLVQSMDNLKFDVEDLKILKDNDKKVKQLPKPVFWNVHKPVSNFFGRKQLLQDLHNHLSQQSHPVVLSGLGGIGKTQSVAKYVEQHLQQYDNVFWIVAKNLRQSLSEILSIHFGYLPEKNASMESFVQMIQKKTEQQKSLLVVDDASDVNEINRLSRNLSSNISLLITTQIDDWDDTVAVVKIDCFDENETKLFLSQEIPLQSAKDIDTLANELQSFPLAIQQAISYINKYKIPVLSYVKYFKESKLKILKSKPKLSDYNKTLLTVWDIAFEKLQSHPKSLLVLGMMAYMDRYYINKNTFLYYKDIEDELELNEIVEVLSEHSLVNINDSNGCLQIHGLVQKVVQIIIDEGRFAMNEHPKNVLKLLLSNISSEYVSDDFQTDENNLCYPHIIYLFNHEHLLDSNIHLFLQKVACNRDDFYTSLTIAQIMFRYNEQWYDQFKSDEYFLGMLFFHEGVLTNKLNLNTLTLKDVTQLDEKIREELDRPHEMVLSWKIRKASSMIFLRKVKDGINMLFKIYEYVHKLKDTDLLKLQLADALFSCDSEKVSNLLSSVNENHLNSLFAIITFYRLQFNIALKTNLNCAEQLLSKLRNKILERTIASNHQVHFQYFKATLQLLLKKGEYQHVLLKIDNYTRQNSNWDGNDLVNLKAWALFKLKRYHEAKTILSSFSVKQIRIGEALLLCYVKFIQNDLIGIDKLLSDSDEDEELLYWIRLYSMTWADFNRQRHLIHSEKLLEKLTNVVKLKQCISFVFENRFTF